MTGQEPESDRTVASASPNSRATYSALIGPRLYLHTYIRLLVVAIIVVGTLVARHFVGIEPLNERFLYTLAAVLTGYNAAAWLVARQHRKLEGSSRGLRRLTAVMYTTVAADFLSLTAATWAVGGARSPFLIFYLVHVLLGCVLFSKRIALTFASVAYALLAGLVVGEWLDLIPQQEPIGAIAGTGELDGRYVLTVLVVFGLAFALTTYLLLTLTKLLRQGERRILDTNLELRRLSEMRRNFLHIALHNLQSSVGASTMVLNNLRDGLVGSVTDEQRHWLDRALRRLASHTDFVTDLQTLAVLESGHLELHASEFEVAEMLESVVDEYRAVADSHHHELVLDVDPGTRPVRGIERLIREAVVNYVTNAIKYTPDGGTISIRALGTATRVRIEVSDNGIGISSADQDRLFNEFVRIERDKSPVGKVSGSGLGLSIVRRVVEAHGGRAFVTSSLDAGSTFVIELPLNAAST